MFGRENETLDPKARLWTFTVGLGSLKMMLWALQMSLWTLKL